MPCSGFIESMVYCKQLVRDDLLTNGMGSAAPVRPVIIYTVRRWVLLNFRRFTMHECKWRATAAQNIR